RLRGERSDQFLVGVIGHCPGVVLEDLEVFPCSDTRVSAINLENLAISPEEAPVVVRNCRFRGGMRALRMTGKPGGKEVGTSSVIVRDNTITDCKVGVVLVGLLDRVQVAGNVMQGAGSAGISVTGILPGTQNVLISNNTLFECDIGVVLYDTAVRGKKIDLRSNLFLACRRDLAHLRPSPDSDDVPLPG